MSLKPKKYSELKREQSELKEKMQKKKKEINDELPHYTYIVSEGTKTEPYYFSAELLFWEHAQGCQGHL